MCCVHYSHDLLVASIFLRASICFLLQLLSFCFLDGSWSHLIEPVAVVTGVVTMDFWFHYLDVTTYFALYYFRRVSRQSVSEPVTCAMRGGDVFARVLSCTRLLHPLSQSIAASCG